MIASSNALSSPDIAELAPVQHFYKGQVLAKQDAPCTSLFRIGAGQVLLSRRKDPDSYYALTLLGPGEVFGEGSLRPHGLCLSTAKAVSDGWCNVIPAARVPRVAQYYPDFIVEILQLLSGRLERAHRRLDVLMRDSARERVLGMLQLLAGYHGEERENETLVEIAVTQAELASMVNLQRETVARALADLEEEGLIQRKPRRGVCLLALPKAVFNDAVITDEVPD